MCVCVCVWGGGGRLICARHTHKTNLPKIPLEVIGNVLFNDTLNTFYLWLFGIRHIVEDHSDSERGKPAAATWATLSD